MDPISQAIAGAITSASFAKRTEVRRAAAIGAVAGLAPDLDVLIRSSHDPLLFLEFHRQFTHSFAFIPLGALLTAGLCRLFLRDVPFARVYPFALLGYASHGLLDACTSYGTQLLWPFSEARVAWNQIAVVDPVFTTVAILAVGWACVRCAPRAARLGLIFALAYLLAGAVQRERAEDAGRALASERGHGVARIVTKPVVGSLLLWKSVYESDGRYYVDALRMGPTPRVFEGEAIDALSSGRDLPWLAPDSRQARDLERFRRFSADWLALDPRDGSRVIDVRYSLVPNEIDGLWGIELARDADPEEHAGFFTERKMTAEKRTLLLRLFLD